MQRQRIILSKRNNRTERKYGGLRRYSGETAERTKMMCKTKNADTHSDYEETETEILKRAIEHYGETAQIDKAIEEMSELIKALLKERLAIRSLLDDKGDDFETHKAIQSVNEEIADVGIMLDQLKLIHGEHPEIRTQKLCRLKKRIESEKKEATK